jgi:hypothetical protein
MYICNKWYVLYVEVDCQLASWPTDSRDARSTEHKIINKSKNMCVLQCIEDVKAVMYSHGQISFATRMSAISYSSLQLRNMA